MTPETDQCTVFDTHLTVKPACFISSGCLHFYYIDNVSLQIICVLAIRKHSVYEI